jgi:hypothetical protein
MHGASALAMISLVLMKIFLFPGLRRPFHGSRLASEVRLTPEGETVASSSSQVCARYSHSRLWLTSYRHDAALLRNVWSSVRVMTRLRPTFR